MDDSTHIFHNIHIKNNILTVSSIKAPLNFDIENCMDKQVGKEVLIRFLNTHKFLDPVSHTFWSLEHVEEYGDSPWSPHGWRWRTSPPLLMCREIWSCPVSYHPLLPPSPSPPCTGLPQSHPTLSCAWLSWLWGHSDGDSTRKQLQLVLLRARREDQTILSERREGKEKLNKLPRGEQNMYQAQPKPGPQRAIKGRTNLPWAEGKAVQKAFWSPSSRVVPSTAQGAVHWQIPLQTSIATRPQEFVLFIQKWGKRPWLHLGAVSLVQREMSLFQVQQCPRGNPTTVCWRRACLTLQMFIETLYGNGGTHPRFFCCIEILFMYSILIWKVNKVWKIERNKKHTIYKILARATYSFSRYMLQYIWKLKISTTEN